MKQKLNIAMCAVLMAAATLTACQGEAEDVQPQQPAVTYPMSFDARLTGFDAPETRATTEWPDKAAHPYVTQALQLIQQRVHTASGDAATRAHYKDLDMKIKLAFEK